MPKLIFTITLVLALIVGGILVVTRGNTNEGLLLPFIASLLALVALGGYVLWRAGSARWNNAPTSAATRQHSGLDAEQSNRLPRRL